MNSQTTAINRSRSVLWLLVALAAVVAGCAGEPCGPAQDSAAVNAPATAVERDRAELTQAFRKDASEAARDTLNSVSIDLAERLQRDRIMLVAAADPQERG